MTHEEFKASYLPLSDGLYRIAYHYLEDGDDARDVVQDLYIKLWNSKDKLDAVANPQAYCYTLVKNLSIDRIRRNRKKVNTDSFPEMASDSSPDRTVTEKETLRRTWQLIGKLPPKQQEIIRLRVFEGLEYDEIARKMGLSEINARVQLSLARKTLKSKLKES